ncbi:MAG: hypothetical protein V4580_08550 [Bacteroidota bacterium]
MKKILLGILTLSLLFNAYCLVQHIKRKKNYISPRDLMDVNPIGKENGIENFEEQLTDVDPFLYKNKNYFLIQTWNSITCTFEGQKIYMKILDSIAGHYKNGTLGFLFVTEMSQGAIDAYQKNQNFYFKHVTFVPSANDFISSVFIQKKLKFKKHPAQFIINKKGDILYYKTTPYTDVSKDTVLIYNLNKFNL